jgi:CDGSH-type Zn-finger protein
VCDQDGNPIEVSRRTIALCRCGRSRMRPFCDGTHRLVGFRAPSSREPSPGEEDASAPDADAGQGEP